MPIPASRSHQGAAALEFALTLPLLLLLLYGMVAYSLLFVLQQQLTLAAAEGGRAAMRYAVDATARNAAITAAVQQAVSGWPTTRQSFLDIHIQTASGTCPSNLTCLAIVVNYPYAAQPILPSMLGLPYPTTISSQAAVQLDQLVLN
ncbi:TadE/TadG family type IV pilus assembly protein [Jeongeupia wiesaeckerbachi]|uniref:TadE/TadG family type IV pilus assembly protein n=1 Tax=Jeongeupia wiesaeckerbachi TaxID=3051218 RepID=UPI003D804726